MIKIVILVITIFLHDYIEGQIGPHGYPGPRRYARKDGLAGVQGERWITGPKRDPFLWRPVFNGLPGQKGQKGERGPRGPAGKDGKRGLRGNDGLKGECGDPGRPGPTGQPGMPAPVPLKTNVHHVSVTRVFVGIIGIALLAVILFIIAFFIYAKKEIQDLKQANISGRFRSVNPDISTKESVRYRGQGHEQANQEEQTDKDIGESNLSDRQKLVEL